LERAVWVYYHAKVIDQASGGKERHEVR